MGNKSSKSGDSSKVDTTRSKKSYDKTYDHALLGGRTVNKNILLVGISGRGKSATGNSIFGSPVFRTFDSAATNPDSIVCESREVNGLKLTICDALTIQDVRMTEAESRMDIKARLHKCFDVCPTGFHFIIFVFSYTSRITSEEDDAMEVLTELFGEQFLIDQGISVFTHGENFDLERKRNGGPKFDTWHKKSQDPLLRKIFSNMETFMMYNVHLDKMERQRQEILKIIRNCRLRVLREQHCYKVVDDVGEERYSRGHKMDTGSSSPRASRAEYGRRPSKVDEAQYRYRSDEKRREDRDVRPLRSSLSQMYTLERKSYSWGEIDKTPWSDVSSPQTDHRGHAAKKTWNLILVCNSDQRGKAIRNVLLGSKKDRITKTRENSKMFIETKWEAASLKVMDGKNLLNAKKTAEKQHLLNESFEHFRRGFHALVLVLSKKAKLTKREIKAVGDLKEILGQNFIRDRCILLYPYDKKLLHDVLSPKAGCEQQEEQMDLINECNRRVVSFYPSRPEKNEEFINDLVVFMQEMQRPFTGPVLREVTV